MNCGHCGTCNCRCPIPVYKRGQVVRLRGHKQRMVIDQISSPHHNRPHYEYKCVWLNESGCRQAAYFSEHVLTINPE